MIGIVPAEGSAAEEETVITQRRRKGRADPIINRPSYKRP
jgi:hypothetical protein